MNLLAKVKIRIIFIVAMLSIGNAANTVLAKPAPSKHQNVVHKDSRRTCQILNKKRMATAKKPLRLFASRPRYRAMAETDMPAQYARK